MELPEILTEINVLFQKVLSNNSIALKMETTARDVDGWDSLNHMDLIASIEKHFKIRFALKEIMKFKNVQDMCVAVYGKIGA